MKLFGWSQGRNLSKMVFLFSGVAISTIPMSFPFFMGLLDFPLGIEVRNLIAISLLLPIFLMVDDRIVPFRIPKINIDKSLRRWVYSGILVLVGISISTISFPILEQFLNITILDFELLAVRNFIAAGLFWALKVLHFR